MGKNLLAALTAMLLFLFPSFSGGQPEGPAGGACRCLAVGMDLFVTEENTAPCSANNAGVMAALFEAFLPEGTAVTSRVNGPGSAGEFVEAILDAFGGAKDGDVSYLYLSTHGVDWDEDDGPRTALLLSDGEREEAVEAAWLRGILDGVPGRKVLILDCCHAAAIAGAFDGPDYRVIAGCGENEECYFVSAGMSGTGYFTSALDNALRASDIPQIDPDGDGKVSLPELAERLREIYGVSGADFLPEEPEGDPEPLFYLPEERGGQERLLGLAFGTAEEAEEQVTLSFHFRTDTAVKIEYRLVPRGAGGWDFGEAARLPDRERTGQTRGLLSPGEKDRSIRVSRDKIGDGALLEIISFRGEDYGTLVPEATIVIRGKE